MTTAFRSFLVLLAGCGFSLAAIALQGSPGETFVRGNIAYGNGEYAEAVLAYQSVLQSVESAEVHYNLGNALAQENEWSEAAFHYMTAYSLNPGFEPAQANLLLAAQRMGKETDYPLLPAPANLLPVNTWVWVAAGAFWIAVLFFGHAYLLEFRFPLRKTLGTLSLLVMATASIAVYQHAGFRNWGIVSSESAVLRVAPTEQSPGETSVRLGDPVRVLNDQGTFYHVMTPTGEEGFVLQVELHPLGND